MKQGCTCCNAQMGDLNQNNNKNILWQKTQRLNNQTKFDSTKHKLWTESCEGSGGSALGDTLNKALLISWIGITLYYFRIL